MAETKYVSTFALPSEYERAASEARRRRRMAEMLAAQAYQPSEGGVAPIPAAAPLVQGLQAFLTARQLKKAEEAEAEKGNIEQRTAREIMGRLMGADVAPMMGDLEEVKPAGRLAPSTPQDLSEVDIESQYRYDPQGAIRKAMTTEGSAALRGNPLLAAALQKSMEPPVEPKAPTTVGGMMWNAKQGQFVDIPGYESQQGRIAAARRPDVVMTGPKNEPLVSVKGPDGSPILVPRSQAAGMTPYSAKQEAADVERVRSLADKSASTQTALDNIAELLVDPGRKAGTGASAFLGNIPGTAARSFQARLETFKAQTFIPMVSALKGMGALSDAEGKKLSAAVGALDPSMREQDFESELRKVAKTLYGKAKIAGLDVVMPEGLGDLEAAPSRSKW